MLKSEMNGGEFDGWWGIGGMVGNEMAIWMCDE